MAVFVYHATTTKKNCFGFDIIQTASMCYFQSAIFERKQTSAGNCFAENGKEIANQSFCFSKINAPPPIKLLLQKITKKKEEKQTGKGKKNERKEK